MRKGENEIERKKERNARERKREWKSMRDRKI